MKTFLTAAAIGLSILASAANPALAQPNGGWRGDQREQSQDRQSRSTRNDNGWRQDRQDHYQRREAWRDDRPGARWDPSAHNGYYRNNTFYYGKPAQSYRGVTYGYQPWQTGSRLGYYDRRFPVVDYRRANLRQPPRGYHWVRDNDGDYLLAAIVGGLIADVIINSGR